MKHLWEVNHPYYMNEGNYYKSGEHLLYESFEDFMAEWGGADRDMNRVHRWDWRKDDELGYDLLSLYFVLQRKARLMSCEVKVSCQDEPAVAAYLLPFAELESRIWEPFLDPRNVTPQP